jgi:GH25 family lysozyme M1 (1,4-beta-N-acetylmuramidase)
MIKRKIISALVASAMLALSACGGVTTPTVTVDPHLGQVLVSNGAGGEMWVKDYDALPRNEYKAECFASDGEYITYSDDEITARRGIDVSYYQGDIDWEAVAGDGVEFAIIRAGYRGSTEGVLHEDERFAENLSGAVAAGLDVGVYFFSQAITAQEAAEEAQFVLELLGGQALDLPIFFDWEHIGSGESARTDSLSGAELTGCCLAFCEVIRSGGYDAGVYFYRSLGYDSYELDRLDGLTIWCACPGDTPDFYYDFDLWQYSYTATVAGIEGQTDLDLLF